MAQLYILNIMRKTGTTKKQTSYDVIAKILIVDDADDADDKWMMFDDSAYQIGVGSGHWFRVASMNRVVLTGNIGNGMIRNEFVIDYESWPLRRGTIGSCSAAAPIRNTDDSVEYHYFVERVQ